MEFTYRQCRYQGHIGMIRRMKDFVPQSTLISVYNAIVKPHFDYCSLIVWDMGNAYSLEELQKMQNRAAERLLVDHTK